MFSIQNLTVHCLNTIFNVYMLKIYHFVVFPYNKSLFASQIVEKLFKYINKDGDSYVSRQEIMDLIANLTYAR